MIVAFPELAPDTRPLVDIDATEGSELDQPTARPVISLWFTSVACAVSCSVEPEASDALAGVTESAAIAAAEMLTVAVSPTPEADAMIRAVPVLAPMTMPDDDTVAYLGSLELHETG